MYKNVGAKIKTLAKVIGILNLVSFVIIGLLVASENDSFLAFLFFAVAGAVAFMFSWFGYAFGQLVEDVHSMRESGSRSGNAQAPESKTDYDESLPEL